MVSLVPSETLSGKKGTHASHTTFILSCSRTPASDVCTEVRGRLRTRSVYLLSVAGLVPPLLLEAPKRATKLYVLLRDCVIEVVSHAYSAANDFWGKTYLNLTGESKMTQQLSILTGCSAGATESFVVVPFELVKIRCVCVGLREAVRGSSAIAGSRTNLAHTRARWML